MHAWLPGGVRGCQGGMRGEGTCMAKGGHAWRRGDVVKGACMVRGCAW